MGAIWLECAALPYWLGVAATTGVDRTSSTGGGIGGVLFVRSHDGALAVVACVVASPARRPDRNRCDVFALCELGMSHPLQPQLQSISRSIFINHTPGILTITDANTTIGYCRYNESGEIEYIFVNSAFRRKGHAKQLLKIIEARLQRTLSFQTPISPLGKKLKDFYQTESYREVAPM